MTGKPVRDGWVNSFTFLDNPHIGEFPGFRESGVHYGYLEEDGRFEVVVLPGRGLIGVRAEVGEYRGASGVDAIQGYNAKMRGFDTFPLSCHIGNYHTIVETSYSPGTDRIERDIEVDPGRSLTVRVVDPDGKPLSGTKASGLSDLFSTGTHDQDSAEFEVRSLAVGSPRRVTVVHAGRKLVGSVYFAGDENGPLTIRLQPWGVITGRVVDEDGKPRPGLALSSRGGSNPKPPEKAGILPGGDWNGGIRLGQAGSFRVEGLVPGLKYGAHIGENGIQVGNLFQDITVEPGEVKDLGDLKMTPYKDDE